MTQPPQGYPHQSFQQNPAAWSPPYPQPAVYPAAPPAALKKRTAAGVVGLVLALIAAGGLVLALLNLVGLDALKNPTDDVLPHWVRAIMFNGSLRRVRMFAGVTTAVSLVSLILGVVSWRSVVGKIALVFTGLVMAGSVYAQVASAGYDYMNENLKEPDTHAVSDTSDTAGATRPGGYSTKHISFTFGRKLALASFGRARGADAQAVEGVTGDARTLAASLSIAPLPPMPALSGNESADTADALHYLLDTAGKPIWRDLESKHSQEHAALFEIGVKLQVLRLLHADDKMATGLVSAIQKLAAKAGVAGAADGLTGINGNSPEADVNRKIDDAQTRIEALVR
jgi:hypothetical protein